MATNEQDLRPRVLVVPKIEPAGGQAYAPEGSICISGGRLMYCSGAGLWTLVEVDSG